MSKKIKITMTDRRPLLLDSAQWDLIARADWYSGQHECQANEIAEIKVRRHDDGRVVVYGWRDRGPGGMAMGYRGTYAGELTTDAGMEQAIATVAEAIGMPDLADECLADLPAEEI